MIDRQVRTTPLSPGRLRYHVLVTGEPCPPQTHESRMHLRIFLDWILSNQPLLDCGYDPPQAIKISHNGRCWQAEAEAEVADPAAVG